jgi:hypothetical protein
MLSGTTMSKDEQREVGLGPDHDWSPHAADTFDLMPISYREPSFLRNFHGPINYQKVCAVYERERRPKPALTGVEHNPALPN